MNQISKIIFLLFLLSKVNYAQNQDQEAKSLLDEVNSKINSYNNIQISFQYVLENEDEFIRQETFGELSINQNKYVLEVLGITRIFDGSKLYTISKDDEEVTISSNISEDENTILPNNLLNFFENGYNFKLDILQNKFGRDIQYIKFTPIDSNSEISYILLGIDLKTKHIYNLIEIGKNSTKSTITILNFNSTIELEKSFFNFNKSDYPDYYINKID